MLELGGRPLLDRAVRRLRAAPVDEIRIVVRPAKQDVVDHARKVGLTVIAATPETLASSVLAGIAGLAPDDIVLVDLPDSLWEPEGGFRSLLDALRPATDVALGVFRSTEPERGDVVELAAEGRVRAVHVKPADPPGELIWGAFAARARALQGLRRHPEPGHLFDELARRGRVGAVRFPGEFLDVGTKEALARARRLQH